MAQKTQKLESITRQKRRGELSQEKRDEINTNRKRIRLECKTSDPVSKHLHQENDWQNNDTKESDNLFIVCLVEYASMLGEVVEWTESIEVESMDYNRSTFEIGKES